MACTPTPGWPYSRACHMFVAPGEVEKLHAFAQAMGIPRRSFQPRPDLPHYDLNAEFRALALARGAVEVDRRFVVGMLYRWRESIALPPPAQG
ncbi:DUF4031 domain-containing protein [Verrucomicrobia bacterium LW23]|nr:DUF4031 domain-containing protein [Verrucomicrobia bacterium LW23]